MSPLPSLNPLIVFDAVCSTCGNVMEKTLQRYPKDGVVSVIYRCVNEPTGCNYQVESSARLNGLAVRAKKGE